MTPLAHRIVKELTLPIKKRTFIDRADLLGAMNDIHCFECSAIDRPARDIWNAASKDGREQFIGNLAFLPAPKTWIEFRTNGVIVGFLLVQTSDPRHAQIYFAISEPFGTMTGPAIVDIARGKIAVPEEDWRESHDFWSHMSQSCMVLLAFINTPRIIGRRQHMPHKTLERKLVRSMGGAFPLHAWSEILLDITPPAIDGEEHEAHLTGARALHFCRAHLRVRLGRLELVSAHWRGDAALGIKQSRYKLVS